MSFVSELRRRRVLRVAAIYGAAAWIITEVTDTVGPLFFLPDWTTRFVVIALAAGFPIAMIMAWVFDVGPQGLERTPDDPRNRAATESPRQKLVAAVTLVAATGLLAVLLYQVIGQEAGPKNSIAVLPFENLSGDPGKDYFSDGISEELLNLLARVPYLNVAARTSSFAYRDKSIDARDIARELGVATILEGSVRWAGDDDIRITAQLIDGDTGYHLWSDTYDRQMSDIFKVQDEISKSIVQKLKLTLEPQVNEEGETLVSEAPTSDVKAYQFYLQGRHEWNRRGDEAIRKSIKLYHAALGRDPAFARASAALAAAYVLLPDDDPEVGDEPIRAAYAAALKALAQDDTLAEAHAVLAKIDMDEWNWTDAEAGFFFATALDSHDATAQHWYSVLLRNVGRLGESLATAEKAYELDSDSPAINANLANVHMLLGNNAEALEFADKATELGFYATLSGLKGIVYMRTGDHEEAEAAFAEFAEELGTEPTDMVAVVQARRDPGLAAAMVEAVEVLGPGPEQFWTYVCLERGDLAMSAVEALAEKHTLPFEWLWSPEARGLREQPGFEALLEKAGLIKYWQQYGWPEHCQSLDSGVSCS